LWTSAAKSRGLTKKSCNIFHGSRRHRSVTGKKFEEDGRGLRNVEISLLRRIAGDLKKVCGWGMGTGEAYKAWAVQTRSLKWENNRPSGATSPNDLIICRWFGRAAGLAGALKMSSGAPSKQNAE